MTNFLYLDKRTPKESPAIKRIIKSDFVFEGINLEMALINLPSKITELTTINPMVCKNSLRKFDIKKVPILIPTEDSLESFVNYEIKWALPSDGSIDLSSYDEWRKSILSLIVLVLQKNIIHLSDFYKSNDH